MEMPKIKRGTLREDGRLFWGCERRKENTRKGYTEIWLTPEAFIRKKAKVARACKKIQDKNRLEQNAQYFKGKQASKHAMQRGWLERPKEMMVVRFRAKCKRLGLPFNITAEDFEIPEFCPLVGIPLARGTGKATMNSPELDRLIPSLGYVKNNVWVISRRANMIKSDATLEEIQLVAKNLAKFLRRICTEQQKSA